MYFATTTKEGNPMYTRHHCEPAARIIAKFGGVCRTAELLKLDKSNISRWATPSGTNGRIPKKHHAKILEIAKIFGIEISPEDLINPK